MKSILLATAASVAFAGAASAEVLFTGSAALSYNNGGAAVPTNRGMVFESALTATLKQELNNGITASGSVTIDVDQAIAGNNIIDTYSVGLSASNATLAFGNKQNGAVYTVLGDTYDGTAGKFGMGKEVRGLTASYTMGESTIYASLPVPAGNAALDTGKLEIAGKTTVSGWSIMAGAAKVGTKTEFGAKFSGSVAGATLSGGFATLDKGGKANQWDIKVAYPVGPVTVSANYDEASIYTLGASYAANGVTVAAEYVKGGAWKVDATYDYGSGIKVLAGLGDKGKDFYAAVSYDLGNGASILGSYAKDGNNNNNDDKIGAPEYKEGATVKISFAF